MKEIGFALLVSSMLAGAAAAQTPQPAKPEKPVAAPLSVVPVGAPALTTRVRDKRSARVRGGIAITAGNADIRIDSYGQVLTTAP